MNNELKNAYYAGLIDGEGSILLKRRGKLGLAKTPVVIVGMTCPDTIYSLKEYFGCGSVSIRLPQKNNLGKKIMYYWTASSNQAKEVCNRILPYLITKREAAEKLLAYKPINQLDYLTRDSRGRFLRLVS